MLGRWLRLLRVLGGVSLGAFAFGALVVLPNYAAYVFLRPAKAAHTQTPSDLGMAFEDVTYQGDGVQLGAWYVPGSSGRTVIVLHGLHGGRSDAMDLAASLHKRGYGLLLGDLRGFGGTGGEITTYGYREPKDTLGAIEYLKTRRDVNPKAIGLMGLSMGAATVLQAAAMSPDAGVVVADSPFATLQDALDANRASLSFMAPIFPLIQLSAELQGGFRAAEVRPIDAVARISPRPLLLIHGTLDRTVPVANSERIFVAAREPKELWLVPEAGHVEAISLASEEYQQRVGDFLDRAFGGPTSGSRAVSQ